VFELRPAAIEYHDRIIVRVVLPGGEIQPFYKSSGRCSGRPGEWFPFDGIAFPGTVVHWFDKTRYELDIEDDEERRAHPLYRFGTQQMKDVSAWLAGQEIPPARKIDSDFEVNEWLEIFSCRSTCHFGQCTCKAA
jgi:hypothetical protein